MFSCCQDKILALGEGGIIVTDNEDIYQKMQLLRSHGRADDKDYFKSNELFDYVALGYNWRMPTILAALGLSQLSHINDNIYNRRELANYYYQELIDIEDIILPILPMNFFHVYQKFTLRILKGQRNKFQAHLNDYLIGNKAYFGEPVHKTTYYKNKYSVDESILPNTMEMAEQVVSIPMSANARDYERRSVIEVIRRFYE